MSWNEAPRSKLLGITELKPSEMPEMFGGASASAAGHSAFVVTVFEQVDHDGADEPNDGKAVMECEESLSLGTVDRSEI